MALARLRMLFALLAVLHGLAFSAPVVHAGVHTYDAVTIAGADIDVSATLGGALSGGPRRWEVWSVDS